MYYDNTWGEVAYVHYPITGGIGTMYWEQADLAILLGLWDRVTACGSGSLTEVKNPGWEDLYSFGRGYNVEPELVLSAPISALIAYVQNDGTARDLIAAVESSGSDIDIVCLPVDIISAVLTAGVLFSCEERSELYRYYYDTVQDYVQETVGGLGDDAPTVMTIMMRSTTELGTIEVLGPANTSVPNGMYTYMELSPCTVIYPEDYVSYYTEVDVEWIINVDPDYIVFVSSGLWTSTDSTESIETVFLDTCERFFGQTSAYANGNIIATANGTMNSYMGCFAYLSILQYMFPEIDSDYAEEILDAFFENEFCYYTLDDSPTYKIYSLSNYQ